MQPPRTILIIVGSTRAQRLGLQIAQWVAEVGRAASSDNLEIVDLKDWPLPLDDEPGIPAMGHYRHDHTLAWSRKIASGDGFVFVSPQYNWGYPAALKNALDHLFREWSGKPAMVVTYGGHGGTKCAEQLKVVLAGGLDMKLVATMPGFRLTRQQIEANTGVIVPAEAFSTHLGELQQAFSELSAAFESA